MDETCGSLIPAQKLRFQGVVWGPANRDIRRLSLLGNDTVSVALWMNDQGEAVGPPGLCGNTAILSPGIRSPRCTVGQGRRSA